MAEITNKHDVHNPPQVAAQTPVVSQRRRRLLKGAALAVPAVLTLRQGAAQAVTSVVCVGKGVDGNGMLTEGDVAVDDQTGQPIIVILDNDGNFMDVTTDQDVLNMNPNAFQVSTSCWDTSVMGAMMNNMMGG